jgi:hypothetical protein
MNRKFLAPVTFVVSIYAGPKGAIFQNSKYFHAFEGFFDSFCQSEFSKNRTPIAVF